MVPWLWNDDTRANRLEGGQMGDLVKAEQKVIVHLGNGFLYKRTREIQETHKRCQINLVASERKARN